MIITIGREYGSGGRAIGKEVAKRMGVRYYDKELIDETAKISGLSAEYVQSVEESVTSSFLYNIVMNAGYSASFFGNTKETLPLDTQVYLAQQEAILKFAEDSCVIVGRCADHVLKGREKLLRCFIYAPLEDRVRRAVEEYGIDEKGAKKTVQQMDKNRSSRYNAYTDQTWGARDCYDLMINSSVCGERGSCDVIMKGIEQMGAV